jgi:dTDP-4-dehydrorhamnose reductase
MTRKRLLITGASGFLGGYLCAAAQEEWEVYGTTLSKAIAIPNTTLLQVDLTDHSALQGALEVIQPDAVIHAAALSQPNVCEINPEVSFAINVQASWWIAEACADRGISCIFTSTDQVFDGRHAPYRETSEVAPVNCYGKHKVLAEVGMRSRHPRTCICRLPLMFGTTPHAPSFLQGFIAQLQQGKPLKLFTDEYRTPASGSAIAQGMLLALHHQLPYLHLGGKEKLSRYEFGLKLVERLQLPKELILPCRQADVPMAAPRPADVALDSALAFSIGYAPAGIIEELQKLSL